MSRKPFDQNPVVPFARPASADLNLITSYSRQALMYFLQQLYSRRTAITNDSATPQGGFIGEAFKVRALDVPVLAVSLSAGLGFQYAPSDVPTNLDSGAPNGPIAGLDDLSGYKPLVNPTALNIPIYTPLPGVGNSRYDIIEVRFRREFTDYSQDLVFDPIANDFLPKSVPQALTWAMDLNQIGYVLTPSNSTLPIGYKVGAEALTGTQVEPPTTPGYTKIARILVAAGATAITTLQILDNRQLAFEQGTGFVSGRATIRTVRGQRARPVITSLSAPPGVRVAIFYRDLIPMSGFAVAPNIMIFTGAPVAQFVGGADVVNATTTAPENEKPVIGQNSLVEKNRFIQGPDINSTEMQDPLLAYPAGFYADGSFYSSLRPWLCGWNTATNLWNEDMSTFDPLEFSFWATFSY